MRISKSLQYANVYREDGTILGPAIEHIPREWIEIYQSQVRYSNPLTKDAFWVECPVCGLRGTDLSNHEHCSLKAPMVYTGTCIKCGQTYTIDRETRFRENLLCGKCSMVENQAKTKAIRIENETDEDRENRRIRQTQKLKQTLLERYGCESVMSNPEFAKKNKESRRKSMYEKYGVYSNLQLPEVKEKAKTGRKQFLENAGVTSIVQLPGVLDKIKATNLERYGTAFPLQSNEVRTKCSETLYDRYGVHITFLSPEIRQKIKNTCLERYGSKNPWSSPEIREKIENTCLERYGVKKPWSSPEIREKIENTCLERYGSKNPMRVREFIQKQQNTLELHFGTKYTLLSPEISAKIKETMIERYGVEFPLQSPLIRKKCKANARKSKLEKRFEEFLKNRNFSYLREVEFGNHYFDFVLLDENLEPKLLVDTDGVYYHGHLNDQKEQIYEYDAKRVTYCKNLPFIVIFENRFEEGLREVLQWFDKSYDEYIMDIFAWCKSFQPFPFPNYSEEVLQKTWQQLLKYKPSSQFGKFGSKLINHFHKSVFYAKRAGYMSPVEGFSNDEKLLSAIKNRFIYKHQLDPSTIASGLSIAKIAPKVSIFQPSYAKYLITKYLNSVNTIFDPFSGFSGRMLGTIAAGKQYIGQDCNETTISESRALAKFLDIEPKLTCTDSINSTGEYEALFTCPPYNLKETWGQDIQDLSCDEWIDLCMKNFKCKYYLFVVDKTEKYQQYVVETKTNRSHLNSGSPEKVVFISCV